MTGTNYVKQPYNAFIPVNWYLVSYYPTDQTGQNADVVGVLYKTLSEAETYSRNKLAQEGVGMCLILGTAGDSYVVYPLYEPEAF